MWPVCSVPTALRSPERNSIKERFRLQLRPNSRCIIVSLAESLRCRGVFFRKAARPHIEGGVVPEVLSG